LRAMALRHKLNRLRYKAPQESFWQDLLGLYQKARSRNLATLGIRPYNEDGANTSIQSELLRVLLFEAAPLENLSSEQIECLDRFLCGFLDKAVLRDAPNAQTMFCFEPGKGRGPGRFDPDRPPAGGLFFGPWGAYLEATQALAALDKGQEVAWLQGAPGEGASQLALLRALNFAWSANPPKRIFPREEAAGTMLVVHDFVQVRRMVAASAFARSGRQIEFSASYEFRARIQDEYFGSVDQPNSPPPEVSPDEEQEILTPSEILERLELAGDREQMEIWTAIDRSAEGIGCIVPHQKKWLRVSTVIGYRLPGEIDWQIAVLRRLGRTAEGRRLAGLQLLRGIPAAVYVKAVEGAAHPGQPVAAHALTDFSDGILISAESETLLLDTAEINLDDCLLMVGAGQQQTVVVSEILDQLPGLTVLRYSPASPAA
ncbi:MAG TPA: hypothetical protein VI279_01980, partial [Rhodocyclaceae bacterium]